MVKGAFRILCAVLVVAGTWHTRGECGSLSDQLKLVLPHDTISAGSPGRIPDSARVEAVQESKLLISGLHRLYKVLISSQDRPVCNFVPGCSNYAKEAVNRYGLLWGTLMASDRLLRCNGLGRQYYDIDSTSGRCINPVTDNAPRRH